MMLSNKDLYDLLHEDCPWGDLTTETLGIGDQLARLTFTARGSMTICGIEEAARLFKLAGAEAKVITPSGNTVAAGTLLLEAAGSAGTLHMAYKVAQVLVESTSGIASGTHALVSALVAAGFSIPVACTRKNFPGTKALASKAVQAGGATMHRLGLSETVLLFPEHLMFVDQTPTQTMDAMRARLPEKKIVVEVKDEKNALVWALAGADVLQLEKFSPDDLAHCRQEIIHALGTQRPALAAAGGVNIKNAVDYAKAGADFLVTSAPYFAPPTDVQVTFRVGYQTE